MRSDECWRCLRNRGDLTCDAFPNGIPEKILTGEVSHRDPYAGDGGKTFYPIPDSVKQTPVIRK